MHLCRFSLEDRSEQPHYIFTLNTLLEELAVLAKCPRSSRAPTRGFSLNTAQNKHDQKGSDLPGAGGKMGLVPPAWPGKVRGRESLPWAEGEQPHGQGRSRSSTQTFESCESCPSNPSSWQHCGTPPQQLRDSWDAPWGSGALTHESPGAGTFLAAPSPPRLQPGSCNGTKLLRDLLSHLFWYLYKCRANENEETEWRWSAGSFSIPPWHCVEGNLWLMATRLRERFLQMFQGNPDKKPHGTRAIPLTAPQAQPALHQHFLLLIPKLLFSCYSEVLRV